MSQQSCGHWIFGYGSLIWRPDFPFAEQAPAYIEGFQRRFWQASPDHRGTPEAPGRVVTLLKAAGQRCWGRAYRVASEGSDEILQALDHRERAGYQRVRTALHVQGAGIVDDVLVYVADASNPNFMGALEDETIASVARVAHGPSGSNLEYVLRLAEALDEMGINDPHVSAVARLLRPA